MPYIKVFAMAAFTFRIDGETKSEEERIVRDFGSADLSSVTRAFYRQIVRERRIPLNLSYGEPNEESLDAIRETKAITARGGTGRSFSSGRDLLDAASK